jgi:hypothetical protein
MNGIVSFVDLNDTQRREFFAHFCYRAHSLNQRFIQHVLPLLRRFEITIHSPERFIFSRQIRPSQKISGLSIFPLPACLNKDF